MEDKRAALEDLTEQKVIITFENGHEMRVNVGGDSAAALIYDVTRALIW